MKELVRCSNRMAAKIIEVPVDEEGLVVDRLPGKAAVVYVTP
jgi:DNA-binding transcriptional MocR family regulator